MTFLTLAIWTFFAAWICLTLALVLSSITDKEGIFAVICAFVPTVGVGIVGYLASASAAFTIDMVSYAVAAGLLILSGVILMKEWRKFRARGNP